MSEEEKVKCPEHKRELIDRHDCVDCLRELLEGERFFSVSKEKRIAALEAELAEAKKALRIMTEVAGGAVGWTDVAKEWAAKFPDSPFDTHAAVLGSTQKQLKESIEWATRSIRENAISIINERDELAATVAGMTEAIQRLRKHCFDIKHHYSKDGCPTCGNAAIGLANPPSRAKAITNVIEKARKTIAASMGSCIEDHYHFADLADALKNLDKQNEQ